MTLYIGFVFHIYQPPTQTPAILKSIVKESYRPLFNALMNLLEAKMTFNINGSLLELLALYQEDQLIDSIKLLIQRNQIELLGSSCYHAILPLIPQEEIVRQIELNEQLHTKVLGERALTSGGFWLPEMAYDYRVIEPLQTKNYSWTIISSVATPTKDLPDDYIPIINDKFQIYFRNDLLSNLISFKNPTVEEFYEEMKGSKNPAKEDYYIILAMDGETYGHHVEGLIENFLSPLLQRIQQDPNVKLVKITELPKYFISKKKVMPISSTWSTTEEDLQQGVPFPLWSDPNNRIHDLQKLTVIKKHH
ncbi:MAG: hypothetical protein ACTSSH_13330 [Candidatus Heimdallarchaeota archaeon]